jgi:CRP/FNR family cyclic AMP-dependent transcriptional regulator
MAKNSVAHTLESIVAPALSAPFFDMAPLRELKAGAVLFAAGDTGDGCYRLEQGLLKVMVTSPSGEERIIAILGPGTIVGELA